MSKPPASERLGTKSNSPVPRAKPPREKESALSRLEPRARLGSNESPQKQPIESRLGLLKGPKSTVPPTARLGLASSATSATSKGNEPIPPPPPPVQRESSSLRLARMSAAAPAVSAPSSKLGQHALDLPVANRKDRAVQMIYIEKYFDYLKPMVNVLASHVPLLEIERLQEQKICVIKIQGERSKTTYVCERLDHWASCVETFSSPPAVYQPEADLPSKDIPNRDMQIAVAYFHDFIVKEKGVMVIGAPAQKNELSWHSFSKSANEHAVAIEESPEAAESNQLNTVKNATEKYTGLRRKFLWVDAPDKGSSIVMPYFGRSGGPERLLPGGWVCPTCFSSMSTAEGACLKCGPESTAPPILPGKRGLSPLKRNENLATSPLARSRSPASRSPDKSPAPRSQSAPVPMAVEGPSRLLRFKNLGLSELRVSPPELSVLKNMARSFGRSFSLKVDPTGWVTRQVGGSRSTVVHLLGTKEDVKQCVDRLIVMRQHPEGAYQSKRDAPHLGVPDKGYKRARTGGGR
eukprot:m.57108 g.57108  ORF g.57108 m.57108 type:complete len:521 (-) comp9336_c0_seq2:523-2085(-)